MDRFPQAADLGFKISVFRRSFTSLSTMLGGLTRRFLLWDEDMIRSLHFGYEEEISGVRNAALPAWRDMARLLPSSTYQMYGMRSRVL